MMAYPDVWHEGGKRRTSPEYRSWRQMRDRCLNPKCACFSRYGGRGITLHPAWNEFAAFLADMGRKPSPELTLERVDSNGPYAPWNCKWATRLEQARNRDYATVKAWVLAKKLGVKRNTVYHMVWQIRQKDRGDMKWFALSPQLEAVVRQHLVEAA